MENLKKYLPWAAVFIAFMAILFLIKGLTEKSEPEYIYREVKVEVPVVEHVFDTIEKPVPIIKRGVEIDSTYYKEYLKLKDSVQRDSLFIETIKINEYNEKFEDSVQTINVYTKSRGEVLEQSVKYKTKPREVSVIDSFKVENKIHVNLGLELGVPTIQRFSNKPVLKGNLMLVTKKKNIYHISYDTEGRVWVGKTWKISF